jgi:uncharacterized protein (DUF58 family)
MTNEAAMSTSTPSSVIRHSSSGESRPSAQAVLQRLEWTVLKRLDGLLQGDWRTLFRGHGLDLADLREYQVGDDVRHIDWNVTARTATPHVRQFDAERDLTAWFLLDLSPSVDFGALRRKRDVAEDFVGAMALLVTRHGNRAGAAFYGRGSEQLLPARSGRLHVLQLMQRMRTRPTVAAVPSQGTRLGEMIARALPSLRRRSCVFVVSDFISEPGWLAPLARLAERHDVIAVRLFDPIESTLPDIGMVLMQDSETGEQIFVDSSAKGFRARFEAAAAEREAQVRQALARAGVDTLELATDADLGQALLGFIGARRARARLAAGAVAASRMVS